MAQVTLPRLKKARPVKKPRRNPATVKLPPTPTFPREVFVALVTPNEVFATRDLDRILESGIDGEEVGIYTLQEVRRISRRIELT